jgi:hypothetical protein
MLLRALVTLVVVLCPLPTRGGEPTTTPRTSGHSSLPPASGPRPGMPQAGGDYAHVFYEFSAARGVRLFIRAADGGEREITTEPDWQRRHKAALERLRQTRREEYIRAHPDLDPAISNAIATGILLQGMATEQVRACLGDAVAESRTLTREGLVEEWRYGMPPLDAAGELSLLDGEDACGKGKAIARGRECILHFVDGVLAGWESRASGRATENGAAHTP